MSLRIPKYRLHKGSGQALVQINGKRIYLGKHGSTASKENYRRIIAELCVSQDNPTGTSPERGADGPPASINELILAFWPHVEQRYVKNGSPTSEQKSISEVPDVALSHQMRDHCVSQFTADVMA